jgi:predicted transcriptional regulator
MSKITIELPDEVVARLDELARRKACSERDPRGKGVRQELVREAVEQYIARTSDDELRARSKEAHRKLQAALRRAGFHTPRPKTKQERVAEFERLTERVRRGILAGEAPFRTVEEAMEWLRGKSGGPA